MGKGSYTSYGRYSALERILDLTVTCSAPARICDHPLDETCRQWIRLTLGDDPDLLENLGATSAYCDSIVRRRDAQVHSPTAQAAMFLGPRAVRWPGRRDILPWGVRPGFFPRRFRSSWRDSSIVSSAATPQFGPSPVRRDGPASASAPFSRGDRPLARELGLVILTQMTTRRSRR